MSDYCFGLTTDRITRTEAKRRERVAKKHGAQFTEVNVKEGATPGINNGRYYAWFSAPNHGWPFDEKIRARVLGELGID